MPIQEISKRPQIPLAGIIRLGVREETKSGSSYPRTKEYFVLDDAPNVRKVYGDDPKELTIKFPSSVVERIIPMWYKLWTPSLKRNGKVEQGRLLCKGDGPYEGQPGTAIWYDRDRMPVSGVLGDRDPIRGTLQRACLGKSCPDAFDEKGAPKCKQTMQVFCFLPLVSPVEVYAINTSSWSSMHSFGHLLSWHVALYRDHFVHNYYKIAREEEATRFPGKDGKLRDGVQYIMKIYHIPDRQEFETLNANKLKEAYIQLRPGDTTKFLPTLEEADQLPMDELYPCIEAAKEPELTPLQKSEQLSHDPDVVASFKALEDVMGMHLDQKTRLLGIRAREGTPDQKAAVLIGLAEKIAAATPKAVLPVEPVSPEVASVVVETVWADEFNFGETELPQEDVRTAEPVQGTTMFKEEEG